MDERLKSSKISEMMYLMENSVYHRVTQELEDSDNNAYSLAITFGKENVVKELLSLRRNMNI